MPDSQIITLRNEDLLVPLRSRNLLEISDHFEYTEVRFRVRASAIPINDDGNPTVDRVITWIDNQYRTVIINQWSFHSIPITGSRQKDHFGNIQTEILRHDTYFDIVGILERETEEVSVNSESTPTSEPDDWERIHDEEMEEQERIANTLAGLTILPNPILEGTTLVDPASSKTYVWNGDHWEDLAKEPINKPEPKKKNLYSRKLRIRRKE